MVYIEILVLDQCCCEKNNITCLHIFFLNLTGWHKEGAATRKATTQKMHKMASSWQMSPETGLKIFLQAQVVVSDFLGTKCFNTAIHAVCAIVTCTKHKLKQQSSKQAKIDLMIGTVYRRLVSKDSIVFQQKQVLSLSYAFLSKS